MTSVTNGMQMCLLHSILSSAFHFAIETFPKLIHNSMKLPGRLDPLLCCIMVSITFFLVNYHHKILVEISLLRENVSNTDHKTTYARMHVEWEVVKMTILKKTAKVRIKDSVSSSSGNPHKYSQKKNQ